MDDTLTAAGNPKRSEAMKKAWARRKAVYTDEEIRTQLREAREENERRLRESIEASMSRERSDRRVQR